MTARAPFQSWVPGMPPAHLSRALFEGGLVVFRDLAPVRLLAGRLRELVEAHFGDDPEGAEARMSAADFRDASARARRAVSEDRQVHNHWHHVLSRIGYRPQSVLGDRLCLRIVPSRAAARGPRSLPLPAHRDSWGSAMPAQINLWAPLYPLAPGRTLKIWPRLFEVPVPNNSATWDLDAVRREGTAAHGLLPVAERAPRADGVPVLIEPGSLLAFSGAHLHASASDASGRSRMSFDTRIVWAGDLAAGRGAPDVDGAAGEPRWAWFRPVMPPAPAEACGADKPSKERRARREERA